MWVPVFEVRLESQVMGGCSGSSKAEGVHNGEASIIRTGFWGFLIMVL